uniref:Uncharacterized protein n=1 Tax=viral metagenome TaxID=1070528 RepID=A0A6C0J002_9ZZZZ
MEDEPAVPKKRGRKPLPPEEKMKRGRKRVVHQEIQKRKQQGAPPLQISFVCDAQASATPMASSATIINPFAEHGVTSSSSNTLKPFSSEPEPAPRVARLRKTAAVTALEESDDDEIPAVLSKPRIDVSHLSGEKCIEILGAHTGRKEWPSSTEVACWNCTHTFNGIPLSIPGGFDKRQSIMVGCYGVFCSFNCAKRYCMNQKRHDSMQQLQLLTYLHKKMFGSIARIFPAAPVQVLDKFGGYMGIQEYRKNFITLPPENQMFDPVVRQDYVQLMNERQVPYFYNVLHSHNQQLMTDSIQEKTVRNRAYERTTPLPGSQHLTQIMGIKS